jgi:uncharacterized protein YndB with AHSA1/START domain
MTIPSIKHVIVVNAPVQRVWEALTTPAEVASWLGSIGFEARLGHKFHFQTDPQGGWDGVTHSEITELSKLQRLVFTWYVPGAPITHVSFTLRDLGTKTEITLEHTGWDQFPPEAKPIRDQLDHGWSAGVLPNLEHLLN